jgi:anti-sigma factor RsiW
MNDLPHNELLSAYLDGELTAAERAEVERLLADSPAARQFVEELRAAGNMLRALPREKLPEDLSRQVLRIAERRMLSEEEPNAADEEATPPVPLGRALLRRFANRRILSWLALTAAIALAITINDRWKAARPLVEPEKKIARAKVQETKPFAPAASERFVVQEEAKAERSEAVPAPAKPAGESVALVHCNLTAVAAQKMAFEKLLDANGIAWRQRTVPSHAAEPEQNAVVRDVAESPPQRSLGWQSLAAGEENLVEVEATPAQLEAALAGLRAQPALFRSFSVLSNVRALARTNSAPARAKNVSLSPQVAKSSPAAAPMAAARMSRPAKAAKERLQPEPAPVPPARQRMLFVLHVVDAQPAAGKP